MSLAWSQRSCLSRVGSLRIIRRYARCYWRCSLLPPFAHSIQDASQLPVFDFTTLVNMVHASLIRKPFEGSCNGRLLAGGALAARIPGVFTMTQNAFPLSSNSPDGAKDDRP